MFLVVSESKKGKKWHELPQRVVLCPLEYFTKYVGEVDVKKIFADMTKANITVAIPSAKLPEGYVLYPSKIAPPHPSLKGRDLLKEMVEEAHRNGIKILVYVGVACDYTICEKHPDWASRFADDKTAWHYAGKSPCFGSSPYKQYLLDIIKEMVTNYDIDGIWLDEVHWECMIFGFLCYCDYCKDKFKLRYGADIPTKPDWGSPVWREFVKWQYDTVNEFLADVNKVVKSTRPECIVTNNLYIEFFCAHGHDPDSLSKLVDVPHAEALWKLGGTLWHPGRITKLLRAVSDGKSIWTNVPAWDYSLHTSTSEIDLEAQTWQIIANGGSPKYWLSFHLYFMDPRIVEIIGKVYSKVKRVEEYLVDAEPAKYAALLYSRNSRDWYGKNDPEKYVDCFLGFYQALREEHIPFEILLDRHLDPKVLSAYKVLVLPNAAALSDSQINAIEGFVKNGGGLVATWESSLYYENGDRREDFGLSKVLNLHYKSQSQFEWHYMKIMKEHPITNGIDPRTWMVYHGHQPIVEAERGADAILNLVNPMVKDYYSMFSVFPHPPPGEETDDPALMASSYGKGKAVYSHRIDFTYYHRGCPWFRQLMCNSVRWAANEGLPLETDAPSTAEITLWHQPSKNRSIIHVANVSCNQFNTSNQFNTTVDQAKRPTDMIPFFTETRGTISSIKEIIPIHDVKIKAQILKGKNVRSVFLVFGNKKLDYELSDDYVEFTIPKVHAYDAAVISYE